MAADGQSENSVNRRLGERGAIFSPLAGGVHAGGRGGFSSTTKVSTLGGPGFEAVTGVVRFGGGADRRVLAVAGGSVSVRPWAWVRSDARWRRRVESGGAVVRGGGGDDNRRNSRCCLLEHGGLAAPYLVERTVSELQVAEMLSVEPDEDRSPKTQPCMVLGLASVEDSLCKSLMKEVGSKVDVGFSNCFYYEVGGGLGSVEVTVGGGGSGTNVGREDTRLLGGVSRSVNEVRECLMECLTLVLFCDQGIMCGIGGLWLKFMWGFGLSLDDLEPIGGGGGLVGLSLGWSGGSHFACLDLNQVEAPGCRGLELVRGVERGGHGGSDDDADGQSIKKGTVGNCRFTSSKVAGKPHSGRYSRRLFFGWSGGSHFACPDLNRAEAPGCRGLELVWGVERGGHGGSDDDADGQSIKKGTVGNCRFASSKVAGKPHSGRYSRRLASRDATPILIKAMIRKARLKGCVGDFASARDKLKVTRIQEKGKRCGVTLDCDEANSFMEFAA